MYAHQQLAIHGIHWLRFHSWIVHDLEIINQISSNLLDVINDF